MTDIALLAGGEIVVIAPMTDASNATFLVEVTDGRRTGRAVYKPRRGERPLWDYPAGTLHRREVAAFEVSRALGWPSVPATVIRDGPYGDGAVQAFVDAVPGQHFFTLRDVRLEDMRAFAAFDVVINNGDRKGGHILLGTDGRLWGIDHGVTFGVEPNLRTVVWDFVGRDIPIVLLGDLRRVRDEMGGALGSRLLDLLAPEEVAAATARIDGLLEAGTFPAPGERRPYPWPLV